MTSIQRIDSSSVHKITSGQVVVDLQTAVKEALENSIDSGATSIEIRFRDLGLKSFEVVDNGSGISPADYHSVALKHHTSKLSTFEDLSAVQSFGFRGEALASICALSESVTITTATKDEVPMGTILEFDRMGTLKSSSGKVARQRGTTLTVTGLFTPLPVRRIELSKNIKREHAKALALLNAYALYPCAMENNGIRLTISNQNESGKKTFMLRTAGAVTLSSSVSNIWGPKAMENIVPLKLTMTVQPGASQLKRNKDQPSINVGVDGLISAFAHGRGRTANDRQFLYVNGRPCQLPKIQKVFNEVYKTFNTNQYPFLVANISLSPDAYDVNVAPDKRTIFLHNIENLILALRASLEAEFSSARSTFEVHTAVGSDANTISTAPRHARKGASSSSTAVDAREPSDDGGEAMDVDKVDSSAASSVPPLSPAGGEPNQGSDSAIPPTDVVANASRPRGEAETATSQEDPEETEARPVKRRKLSPAQDASSGSAAASSSEADTLSSPFPASVKTTSNNTLNLLSLRASPSRSTRPLPSVNFGVPPRPSKASGGGHGVQLTLTQTLRGFKASVSGNARSGGPTHTVEESSDEEDELMEPASGPSPPAGTPRTSRSRDGVQTLVPPISTLPSDLPSSSPDPRATVMDNKSARPKPSTDMSSTAEPSVCDKTDIPPVEILRNADARHLHAVFDLSHVQSVWTSLVTSKKELPHRGKDLVLTRTHPTPAPLQDAGVTASTHQAATNALSRVISKDDFKAGAMEVIGQFNLGFIIARLHRAVSEDTGDAATDDLFIIDQHAADEKYNFETLQQTTKIQSQSLLRPRPLELAASDEIVAVDRLEVLRANGFDVSFTEDAPIGQRLHLVSQPQSKSTVFDMEDLEELLSLMHDQPVGQMVRCSKARNMFASRACRKSVMVGKALTRSQMTTVVRQMATLEQPWSCPHGRPTMRHLADMREITSISANLASPRRIEWARFGQGMHVQ